MKQYLNKWEAVIDLHERGFTEDFEISGNNLLWVQQKICLGPKDFHFTEVHRFHELPGNESVLCGITANNLDTKGILLYHFKSCPYKIFPVIQRRLPQPDSNFNNQQYKCADVLFSIDYLTPIF